MRRTTVAAAVASLLLVAVPARAAELPHQPPQKAARIRFAAGFPALTDHQWGFRIGGFGGIARGAPRRHAPVIFVHGNNVDHADWYPVRDAFKEAGWTDQELWALSYNGLGANNGSALRTPNPERDEEHRDEGWDGMARVTNNDVNVPDLYDFVRAVREYTGSDRFSIVAHSLGVTLARKMLKVHPELRAGLVAFVGIAGANHGTSFCPPGTEGVVVSCNEIAANTPWLEALNGPAGEDETYGPAAWLTVSDGTGAGDPAFAGPTYARSPELRGATNATYPFAYHNDLRLDPAIVADYRAFIERADTGSVLGERLGGRGDGGRPGALPATGTHTGPAALALGMALAAAGGLSLRAAAKGRA